MQAIVAREQSCPSEVSVLQNAGICRLRLCLENSMLCKRAAYMYLLQIPHLDAGVTVASFGELSAMSSPSECTDAASGSDKLSSNRPSAGTTAAASWSGPAIGYPLRQALSLPPPFGFVVQQGSCSGCLLGPTSLLLLKVVPLSPHKLHVTFFRQSTVGLALRLYQTRLSCMRKAQVVH